MGYCGVPLGCPPASTIDGLCFKGKRLLYAIASIVVLKSVGNKVFLEGAALTVFCLSCQGSAAMCVLGIYSV